MHVYVCVLRDAWNMTLYHESKDVQLFFDMSATQDTCIQGACTRLFTQNYTCAPAWFRVILFACGECGHSIAAACVESLSEVGQEHRETE
jgi:hypothetical protein